ADRRGPAFFPGGDFDGAAPFFAPAVVVDRLRIDGLIGLWGFDHAFVVSGELCGSGNLACLRCGCAGRKVPAAGTPQRHALGRRGAHSSWRGIAWGRSDAVSSVFGTL